VKELEPVCAIRAETPLERIERQNRERKEKRERELEQEMQRHYEARRPENRWWNSRWAPIIIVFGYIILFGMAFVIPVVFIIQGEKGAWVILALYAIIAVTCWKGGTS
jgi:tRNA uridine 5-carbamoylmethylation protein Kti12